jgi:hypothetical protein
MYHLVNNKNFTFCRHTYLCVLCNSYHKQWLYTFGFVSKLLSLWGRNFTFYLYTTQIQFNRGIFNGNLFFITAKLTWTGTHCCREQRTSTATHGLEWCMQQILWKSSRRGNTILQNGTETSGETKTGSVADRPDTGQKRSTKMKKCQWTSLLKSSSKSSLFI